MKASKEQVGGDHYKYGVIQPAEFVTKNDIGFLEGCVIKRMSRHNLNGGKGEEDIRKAIHECQLILEYKYAEGN